ncbi:DEKNAAC105195 [Brettanomyces naardenensis]|uniref:RNA helicase n=1 Tax=Brettanomyces naardenensis TaxID=13370 RepID=A0A448YSW8_BRENA|nr:DEKNAAC105195 [Brettanomyces naardenensis]
MNEEVWVKVIRIYDGKISLSMKGIDQRTGEEQVKDGQGRLGESCTNGESRGKRYGDTYDGPPKRKSTMDAWELNQMRQAYGVKRSRIEGKRDVEDPFAEVDSEEEPNKEEEEDVEIQLNGTVPPFLAGKLAGNSKTYQPQKAARIPDGSLERIAQNGSRFMSDAREKKMELRKQVERARREKERDADPMKSSDVDSSAAATAIQAWKRQSRSATYGIRSHKSIREQRESLPVFAVRDQLLNIIKEHDMTVIVGETGSGKTTQITQYLAESGYGEKGIVACTQPRRVAAISVAKRVSEEVGCKLGDEVGYQIRFEDCTTTSTIIKYMTDGMLEREALVDPDMLKYSIIMLDEAHERTVATDVLFALLRDAVRRRKGSLKLIITSATLDSSKFSHYFDDCPVFHIEGRTFPVKIYYTKQPEKDYIEAAIDTVMDIHVSNPPGDILVFLTGREEIETCCETIVQKMSTLYKSDASVSELIVLPIYSAMPSEMQSRIFEPTPKGKRKVVIATNIAETSITIDGIYYVVDPGFVKVNAYDAKLGMDSLIVQPISKAQADQRSGRAGRTGPGICYRLYTKKAYEREMAANTVPEILRQNLSNTVLMLKAMGIEDVVHFGFMDRPKEQAILAALQELYILDALDSDGRLTRTGKYMSYFPMEPLMSKTMIQSVDFGCSYEVMVIIAMLSVPDVFYRPREQREKADKAKQQFDDYTGDHLTLLNVYEKWEDSEFSRTWCSDHYVHEKSMRKARDVKIQLGKIMGQLDRREGRRDSSIVSCKGDKEIIIKAFVSGYFKNCAKRVNNAGHYDEEGTFRTLVENTPVHIHPSSALFRKGGIDYVMYHTLILTNQEYMQCVTKIDARWLVKYAPRFYKQAAENELSLMKKREKIEPLWNRFDQGQEWRLSRGRR